jgi:hypothetical protein
MRHVDRQGENRTLLNIGHQRLGERLDQLLADTRRVGGRAPRAAG